jgi:signal transduction histidine kinase
MSKDQADTSQSFVPSCQVHSGGGRIGIDARQSNGSVEISVSDTGIGIVLEDQPTVFEDFRQVGSDDAHKVEGTRTGINVGEEVFRTPWR